MNKVVRWWKKCRCARTTLRSAIPVVAVLLLATIGPMVPVDAYPEFIHVGEGETLVIDEDTDLNAYEILVEGTLVIDGAHLDTRYSSKIVLETWVNVSGKVSIINGSWLSGEYCFDIHSGGVVDVIDSDATNRFNHYSFFMDNGSLSVSNSTLDLPHLVRAERSALSLEYIVTPEVRTWEIGPWIDVSNGSDLILKTTNVSRDVPLIACTNAGNVTINGCTLSTTSGDVLSIDGADRVIVDDVFLHKGNRGIVVNDVRTLTVADTQMEGQDGYGCQLSWLDQVSVDGLTIKECGDVALNITNCTNVTVTDVEVDGVSGDGIGIMSEHSGPFTARNVTVRYAQKGVFMIYTDEVTLEDINVDWCRKYGLHLSFCDGVDIRYLSATEAGVDGIYAASCNGLRIEDAYLDGADECGAYLTHSPTSMTDVTARNCGQYGIRAAVQSTFLVRCDLSYNGLDGFLSIDQGGVGLTDCIVESNGGNGTRLLNAGSPFLKGCRLAENRYAGVWVHYETRAADVLGCDIEGNRWGVVLNGPTNLSSGSSVTVRDTYIHNNSEAGAFNWLDSTKNLDARYCWWGNNTGPYNETRNAEGSGDLIHGGVRFKPWLKLGNLPPIIKGPRDIEVGEEEVGLFFYSASDWDNDPNKIEFSLEGEPGNMTIDPLSGSLTVTPDDAEVGVWSFFITATDDGGAIGRMRVNLTVSPINDPPEILVPEDGVHLGDDNVIRLPLYAIDPDNAPWDLTWSLMSGPEWLEVRPDGTLAGTTTWRERGDHNITVRVEDGAGGEDTETMPVRVVPSYAPIMITGLSTTTAFEGMPFNASILVKHDEATELEWELITNATWLAIDLAKETLVGTPAQHHVGTASVQLTSWDELGQEATLETTIEVIAVNDPPYWVDLPNEVTVLSTTWAMDLSLFVRDDDDRTSSLVFSYEEPDPRLGLQGSMLVGHFEGGDRDMEINVSVIDPHGARAIKPLKVKVAIPMEPDLVPSVSDLFPWVLIALVAALATGIALSYLERRKREREGVD